MDGFGRRVVSASPVACQIDLKPMPGGSQNHDFGAGNACKNRQGTTGVTEARIFAILGGPSVAQGGGNGAQINVKLMRKLT